MAKRPRYVVGFTQGENQVVYGKDEYKERYRYKISSFTEPMTLLQAKRQLKKLTGIHKTVYKLVPIKT